ncbi:cadherin repeat domain-containing protein [Flexithrix dorotheae]|uniref:cadherin repeat domain-containing protein n=1 Tax=Flexithrix dorotheae TaxID=70993 RepID=UPI00035F4904|nr:cadherin repeat domain-containing protein [Flexithrix dorotheae]
MKKTSIARLILLSLLISFFSCSDDEETPEPVTVTMTFNDFSITIPESFDVSNQQMVKISDYLSVETSNSTEANVTYTIVSQSVPDAISISGEYLKFNPNFQLDFETNPVLTAEIKATAGEVSETATITINLTDEYEPAWTVTTISVSIDENPTETNIDTIRLENYDASIDGALTYTLSNQSPDGALQIVDDSIIAVKDAALFDYETNPTITATLEVSNGNGYSQTAEVSIALNDKHEAAWTIEDFEYTLVENPNSNEMEYLVLEGYDVEKDGALTYALSNESPEGALKLVEQDGVTYVYVNDVTLFDFETNPTITATVTATDANGYSSAATITITLTDVIEPTWTIADFELTIDENPEDGDDLGRIEIIGFDYEKDPKNLTVQLIEESPAGAIELHHSEKIFLTIKDPSLFDYETNPTITAKIQISDDNGYTQTGNITITLNEVTNASWTLDDFEITIDENPSENELGKLVLQGYNPVSDGMITYALSEASPLAALKLVNEFGVTYVYVNDASYFDYETNPVITATVTATDANGFSNSGTITITLNDVLEADWILSESFTGAIDENPESGDLITQVMLLDYDESVDGALNYQLSNLSHPNAITLSPFGGLFNLLVDDASIFDYETNPTITGTVTVTDGNGVSKSSDFTINVNDVAENAWFAPDINFSVAENQGQYSVLNYVNIQNFDPSIQGFPSFEFLSQNPTGAMTFNPNNGGAILVSDPAAFDYETRQVITGQVLITMGNGEVQTLSVTVNLIDQND